jgi:hypothetical protein
MDDVEAPRSTINPRQATDAKGARYATPIEPRANVPFPSKRTKRAWQLGLVWSEKVRHKCFSEDIFSRDEAVAPRAHLA